MRSDASVFAGIRPAHDYHALLRSGYQAKKEFVDTVTRAKSRIEAYAEERLFDRDGQRGAEFSLKYNFRWVDEKKDDSKESVCGVAELPAVLPPPPGVGETVG